MALLENIFGLDLLSRHAIKHDYIKYLKDYLTVIQSANISKAIHIFAEVYENDRELFIEMMKFYSQCETTIQKMVVLNSLSFCVSIQLFDKIELKEYQKISQLFQQEYTFRKHGCESILFGLHLFLCGVKLIRNEEIKDAISQFKQSIAIIPTFSRNYCEVGFCYYKMGLYQESLDNLNIAINLEPNSQRTCSYFGSLHIELCQYDVALNYFYTGLKVTDPNSSPQDHFLYKIAICHMKLKQFKEAIGFLRKMKNKNYEHECLIACCLCNMGDYNKAIEKLDELIQRQHDKQYVVHYWKGICYYKQDRYDEAIKSLEKSIALGNTDPGCYHHLASCKQFSNSANKIELHRQAIQILEKLHKQYPKSAEYVFWIGYSLREIDETEEAVKVLQRAAELDPQYSSPLHLIGMIFVDYQRYEEALPYLIRAHQVVNIQEQKKEIELDIANCFSKLNRGIGLCSYAGKVRKFNEIAKTKRSDILIKSKDPLFLD